MVLEEVEGVCGNIQISAEGGDKGGERQLPRRLSPARTSGSGVDTDRLGQQALVQLVENKEEKSQETETGRF